MGELRGVEGEGGVRVSITFLESKYTPAHGDNLPVNPGAQPGCYQSYTGVTPAFPVGLAGLAVA